MQMEKPLRVAVSVAKTPLSTALTPVVADAPKTINYVFLPNGMIIAEK